MRPRDWWIGVMLVVGSVVFHALFPRYDWHDLDGDNQHAFVRIDRWTGTAVVGEFAEIHGAPGRWATYTELRRLRGSP